MIPFSDRSSCLLFSCAKAKPSDVTATAHNNASAALVIIRTCSFSLSEVSANIVDACDSWTIKSATHELETM